MLQNAITSRSPTRRLAASHRSAGPLLAFEDRDAAGRCCHDRGRQADDDRQRAASARLSGEVSSCVIAELMIAGAPVTLTAALLATVTSGVTATASSSWYRIAMRTSANPRVARRCRNVGAGGVGPVGRAALGFGLLGTAAPRG